MLDTNSLYCVCVVDMSGSMAEKVSGDVTRWDEARIELEYLAREGKWSSYKLIYLLHNYAYICQRICIVIHL